MLLYTLMLSSLSGAKEPGAVDGQLVYVKDNTTHTIERKQALLRGVLQLRNTLAYHIETVGDDRLPEPLDDARACGQCPQLINCAMWNERKEKNAHDFAIGDAAIGHLREVDKTFIMENVQYMLDTTNKYKAGKPLNANAWLMRADRRCVNQSN